MPEEWEDESPKSKTVPVVLTLVAGAWMILICTGVFVLATRDSDTTAKAKPPPVVQSKPPADDGSSGMAFLGGMIFVTFLAAILIAFAVSYILMLAWVARDAKARGVDGGAVWVLIILSSYVVGLLVYLSSRPVGFLVPCTRCGNKRLEAARTCPHCGEKTKD